jgi:hypothetical protein
MVLHPGELMAGGRSPVKIHAIISQAVAGDATSLAKLVAQLTESA